MDVKTCMSFIAENGLLSVETRSAVFLKHNDMQDSTDGEKRGHSIPHCNPLNRHTEHNTPHGLARKQHSLPCKQSLEPMAEEEPSWYSLYSVLVMPEARGDA